MTRTYFIWARFGSVTTYVGQFSGGSKVSALHHYLDHVGAAHMGAPTKDYAGYDMASIDPTDYVISSRVRVSAGGR